MEINILELNRRLSFKSLLKFMAVIICFQQPVYAGEFSKHLPHVNTDNVFVPIPSKHMNSLDFIFTGDNQGQLVQTFAYDDKNRYWIMAGTVGKKPERVKLWAFSQSGYGVREVSRSEEMTDFAHPQDLSSDNTEGDGNNRYWLPGKDLKSIVSFNIINKDGVLFVKNKVIYPVSYSKIIGLFVTISYDNKNLIIMGKNKGGRDNHKFIRVYNLERFLKRGPSESLISEWPLNSIQQPSDQWTQGLASVSNSIYVLTGNHAKDTKKNILTYDLNGNLESGIELVGDNRDFNSKTFEPEGLEITRSEGSLILNYGIAMGSKGNRTFTLNNFRLDNLE